MDDTQTQVKTFEKYANFIQVGPWPINDPQTDAEYGSALYLGSDPVDTLSAPNLQIANSILLSTLKDLMLWVDAPPYVAGAAGRAQIEISTSSLYNAIYSIEQDFDFSQNITIGFQQVDIIVNGQFQKMIILGSNPILLN